MGASESMLFASLSEDVSLKPLRVRPDELATRDMRARRAKRIVGILLLAWMTLGVEVRRRDARERGISMRRVFQPFSLRVRCECE